MSPLADAEPRRIGILAYPGIEALDAVGPFEVFAAANRVLQLRQQGAAYAIEIWAARTGLVTGASGLSVVATRAIGEQDAVLDTLLVAGAPEVDSDAYSNCIGWLKTMAPKVRRVGGVCTGVFLLAEAGLLDGRRAVTHWAFCSRLARRYPKVLVESDPIFLRDGPFYTTAGVTAGMDLALALVQDDLGRDVALEIARLLVLFLKRPGGQSQFSAHLAAQLDDEGPIARLQRWVLEHLDADLSIEALSARVHMSPRSFARHFTRLSGMSPGSFVERARLDAARRALDDGEDRLEVVAARCGIASAEVLRRLFQRRLGVSPTAYRARFRSAV